ncbi:MAG: GntR family transcriptional regulator [Bacteroidota bacterium]
MPVLKDTLPQYRQLYEILKDHIQQGVYTPGDLLPSENSLCHTYELTRPTVRQCLSELVNDGYIKKVKGKGSIVQKKKTGIGILNIKGTTDSTTRGSLVTKVIDAPSLIQWPEDLDFELSPTEKSTACIYMSRLRLIDEQAIFFEKTFLPNLNLPRFTRRNFNNQSLFGTLLKYYNIRITGGSQRIRALEVQAKIADYLQIAPGTPIVQLEKRYETNRPFFHFYSTIWCHTSDYYLEGAL